MGTHGNQMKTTLTRLLRSTPSRLLLAGLICASPLMAQAKDGQTASSMAKAAAQLAETGFTIPSGSATVVPPPPPPPPPPAGEW